MMRQGARRRINRDEGESVFISMTDMTVSFLFIVMILLAFFASKYKDDSTVPIEHHQKVVKEKDHEIESLLQLLSLKDIRIKKLRIKVEELETIIEKHSQEIIKLKAVDPLEQYMLRASAARLMLLEELQGRLKRHFPELPVEVIPEEGALRFQGEGLFESNSYELERQKANVVAVLGETLNELLPCFTFSADEKAGWESNCNPGFSVIEALQIEGHTDSQGDDLYNLSLSTNRAITTFSTMLNKSPELIGWLNLRDQPVISVAGYGKMRPVATNETDEGRATNRRIDMRIIMYTPASQEEITEIESRLKGALTGD